MSDPVVSVIMSSYHHADYIEAAIESVLGQDYDAWELLIADDASGDHTLDVLKKYAGDERIKVFPFRINRQFHMRNFAAGLARGRYIAFLNSDDLFFPHKLKKQIEILDRESSLGAVFTHVQCIDENGRRLNGHPLEARLATSNRTRAQWLRTFFDHSNCVCLSSVVIRRSLFDEIGRFNPLLIQVADLDLWVRICLRAEIWVIPEILTGRRILSSGQNLSCPGPAVSSRLFIENQRPYAHYFSERGLELLYAIFPEIAPACDDTLMQRKYLLCRMAGGMPQRHLRLLAFEQMHELLRDEQSKQELLESNPRLLRSFFLSEGMAGLDADGPGITWEISLEGDTLCTRKQILSYWTAADAAGTVCLSLPNPEVSCRLRVCHQASALKCERFRLYEQQSGNLIYTSEPILGNSALASFDFAAIDFSAISSKWIDMEIDTAHLIAAPPVSTPSPSPKARAKALIGRIMRRLKNSK